MNIHDMLVVFYLFLLSCFSHVWPCETLQTAAHQAPLSLGFSRQEFWSGLPFPSPMHACMLSCFSHVRLCVTPWTAAHQAPLSTGFSRQEYWTGLPFPSPDFLFSLKYIWNRKFNNTHSSIHTTPTRMNSVSLPSHLVNSSLLLSCFAFSAFYA